MTFFYDREWLGWSPEVMEGILRDRFDRDPSAEDLERIEATRETLRSDRFLHEPLVFEKNARAFNGLPLSREVWEPVSAPQMAYALAVMRSLVGADRMTTDAMGESVRGYIAAVLAKDPFPIGFAAEEFGFQPATVPLRRMMPEAPRTDIEEGWAGVMDRNPQTPDAIERAAKLEFGVTGAPPETLSKKRLAAYKHVARLAACWAYLHNKDITITESPFSS